MARKVGRVGEPPPGLEALALAAGAKLDWGPGARVAFATRPPDEPLRRELGLHAERRACLLLEGVASRVAALDVVVVRALADDDSRPAVERVAHLAFEHAIRTGRLKVATAADPAFLAVARDVARNYPRIEAGELAPAEAAAALVRNPEDFDVLLARGTELADLAESLAGGPASVPSAWIGGDAALFVGAAGPDATAAALALSLLLEHVNEGRASDRIARAVRALRPAGPIASLDAVRAAL